MQEFPKIVEIPSYTSYERKKTEHFRSCGENIQQDRRVRISEAEENYFSLA